MIQLKYQKLVIFSIFVLSFYESFLFNANFLTKILEMTAVAKAVAEAVLC
jgi:hypothetical protein